MKHLMMLILLVCFLLLGIVIFTVVGGYFDKLHFAVRDDAPAVANALPAIEQDSEDSASAEKPAPSKAAEAMVRVQVWDDTQANPLDDKAELWFRGHGSVWLNEDAPFGAEGIDIGQRAIGQPQNGQDAILLYPDGRDGKEILIPFTMTEASGRDSIVIHIDDDEIKITGLAIEASTGDATLILKRQ